MTYEKALELTIDQLMRPERWYWVANSAGQFDAAEYLVFNHWDELTPRQQKRGEEVLLRSGRYQAAAADGDV